MVSFTSKLLYLREENSSICFVAFIRSVWWRREKYLASVGIRTLDCTARNVVTVTTALSRLRLRRECKKINISSTLKMTTESVSETRLSAREDFIEDKFYTIHSLTNWTAFQNVTPFGLVDRYQRHHCVRKLWRLHCGFRVCCVTHLTFRHRASCIWGQAFHYSPENGFYIFNQQIYFIIWYLLDRASLI